ncbi:flagellar motor protein MotB [Imbroritus primus]|uniref:Flagellar motor protein MotB n=1 Tax=Imbroritus primus TaxID=3058603 RepID=A0ACD3SN94_9BURK|nr:flagellar motor protein MotB [Burkholderiaceae bacterium PBA]
MSRSNTPTFIVIRRAKRKVHAHHGGSWKIAYADFITAMMAFFLLMWLLGTVSRAELSSIESYFRTPLKVAMFGGNSSGDQSSILSGDMAIRQSMPQPHPVPADAITRERGRRPAAEDPALMRLKREIEARAESNPVMRQYRKQLLIDITSEGLRIQIVDEQNRPMFAMASAEVEPHMRVILREIGAALNDVPNAISLSGHTDATQYSSQRGYSNWELSADRANASRRELVAGGMHPDKVNKVVGLEAAVPLDPQNLYNPINRRISIIVMKRGEVEPTPGLMPVPGISAAPVPDAPAAPAAMSGKISTPPAGTAGGVVTSATNEPTASPGMRPDASAPVNPATAKAGRKPAASVLSATPSAAVPVPPAGPAVHPKSVMAEARS